MGLMDSPGSPSLVFAPRPLERSFNHHPRAKDLEDFQIFALFGRIFEKVGKKYMRGFGIPAMKFLIRSIADAPDIKESMFEWKHHGVC